MAAIPKIAENTQNQEVIQIPTEAIMPNRSQPRTTFENESLHRLAESIGKYGILQPLTVRKMDENSRFSIFKYELVAGERRLRASKLLGLATVPCIVIETDTQTSAALAIIENLHRDDLNIFEESAAIASLIELYKLTQEQIAIQLSLTQAAVANKLRLLRLSSEERTFILENNLTERHARALLRIKDIGERKSVLAYIIKHSLNVKQTEEYIEKLINPIEKSTEPPHTSYHTLLSTIKKAIESSRVGGVQVHTTHSETDTDIIYTISIPKNNCFT